MARAARQPRSPPPPHGSCGGRGGPTGAGGGEVVGGVGVGPAPPHWSGGGGGDRRAVSSRGAVAWLAGLGQWELRVVATMRLVASPRVGV